MLLILFQPIYGTSEIAGQNPDFNLHQSFHKYMSRGLIQQVLNFGRLKQFVSSKSIISYL